MNLEKFKTEIQYLIDQLNSKHNGATAHAKANVKEVLYALLDLIDAGLASNDRVSEKLEWAKARIKAKGLL